MLQSVALVLFGLDCGKASNCKVIVERAKTFRGRLSTIHRLGCVVETTKLIAAKAATVYQRPG